VGCPDLEGAQDQEIDRPLQQGQIGWRHLLAENHEPVPRQKALSKSFVALFSQIIPAKQSWEARKSPNPDVP
jgi:hypothetical protein